MKGIIDNEIFYHSINLLVGIAVFNKYDYKAALLVSSSMSLALPMHYLSLGCITKKSTFFDNLRQRIWKNSYIWTYKKKYRDDIVIKTAINIYETLEIALHNAIFNYIFNKYLLSTCLDYTKILVSNHSLAKVASSTLIGVYLVANRYRYRSNVNYFGCCIATVAG